ncbi:triphosphoribosyl-dephospho-CoA synthase [Klebsiella pneumoniae subsp. pneumoniae]|nr:triphosphoribosyl-dephospho-CoA synthase [Klebsiella pneumoniae subsp. pneumoniae]
MLWQGGVLADGGGLEALRQFDDELIARHLSPGGSADLLAVTGFYPRFPPARFPAVTHCNTAFAPHCTSEGAIISLPGCHQVNTESRHNRIVFTDIVRRLS